MLLVELQQSAGELDEEHGEHARSVNTGSVSISNLCNIECSEDNYDKGMYKNTNIQGDNTEFGMVKSLENR